MGGLFRNRQGRGILLRGRATIVAKPHAPYLAAEPRRVSRARIDRRAHRGCDPFGPARGSPRAGGAGRE